MNCITFILFATINSSKIKRYKSNKDAEHVYSANKAQASVTQTTRQAAQQSSSIDNNFTGCMVQLKSPCRKEIGHDKNGSSYDPLICAKRGDKTIPKKGICKTKFQCDAIYDISASDMGNQNHHEFPRILSYCGKAQDLFANAYLASVSLSFLSFGFSQTIETAQNDKNEDSLRDNIQNLPILDSTDHNNKTKSKLIFNHRILNCNIDISNAERRVILDMLERTFFFKPKKDEFIFDDCPNIKEASVLRGDKYVDSLHSFFRCPSLLGVNYKTLQKIYIMFIADKILTYDTQLNCLIMRKDLMSLHDFFGEFYVHILWKLDHMDLLVHEQDEDKYKQLLTQELQSLCISIDLQDELSRNKDNQERFKKLTALLYHQVENLRYCILRYLKYFHHSDCTTLLYYFAIKMPNKDISPQRNNSRLIHEVLQSESSQKPIIGKRKRQGNRREVLKRISTEFFYDYHKEIYGNYSIFVLAFTANFTRIKLENPELSNLFQMIQQAMDHKKAPSGKLYVKIRELSPFRHSINEILLFYVMLKEFRPEGSIFDHDFERYFQKVNNIWVHQDLDRYNASLEPELYAYRMVLSFVMNLEQ